MEFDTVHIVFSWMVAITVSQAVAESEFPEGPSLVVSSTTSSECTSACEVSAVFDLSTWAQHCTCTPGFPGDSMIAASRCCYCDFGHMCTIHLSDFLCNDRGVSLPAAASVLINAVPADFSQQGLQQTRQMLCQEGPALHSCWRMRLRR